ncbi:uncharacterized protein EMH_0079520 [Eimeria mitis]|uniref:Uncharacterized protein n=1 Tax=Eimeria mitis TaxID=44415 RepID=U6K5H1_9EIME|nr:uncharacterized protein EMH_0079520 [Eimeria mitis]CDJ33029.1 hypothetical protein, conserved [Eimeria mitis]
MGGVRMSGSSSLLLHASLLPFLLFLYFLLHALSPETAAAAAAAAAEINGTGSFSNDTPPAPPAAAGAAAAAAAAAGGTGAETEGADSSREMLTGDSVQPTLLELMRAAKLERTLLNKPKGKTAGLAALIDTTQLMAVFVTVLVLLYAIRELTLKMSRQARWFKPRFAAYTATDGHMYVVTLDFRGLERVVLPKRYSQQEKENLIGLFERALQYFEGVPPEETSGCK